MKTILLLLICCAPLVLRAQAPSSSSKPTRPEPPLNDHVVSATTILPMEAQPAPKRPAPGAYQSRPDALRILVPGARKQNMPRIALPAPGPDMGIIAPLPPEQM